MTSIRRLLPIALAVALLDGAVAATTPQRSEEAFPAAPPESQGLSSAALAALAAEVDGYLARDLMVGGELLVIKNRRTVLHRYYGLRDRERGVAWTEGTVCNIRSMTKTLTGAAAQILIDRRELFLDDRVADHLPGFDTPRSKAITVEQLLTHRAGLPLTIITRAIDEFPDLLTQANAVGARGPDDEPGSRFWYSDAGTDALGAIVEVVSGMRLDEFVREELLEPLGMADSFYDLDPDDPRRAEIACAYMGRPGSWNRFFDPATGALYPFAWGSQTLYSTPVDYAKFLALWLDGGRAGDRAILSPEAVERTLAARSEMSMLGSDARFPTSFRGLEVFYGQMAVVHCPAGAPGEHAPTIVGHSGSDGTIAWGWPKLDLMILFFTQSRGGTAVLRLEEAIERLLLAPDAHAKEEAPPEVRPLLGSYVADWGSHMQEELAVAWRGDKLVLDVPTELIHPLEPLPAAGRWRSALQPALTLWFERDAAGQVDCLRIQEGDLVHEAPRKGSARAAAFAEKNRLDPDAAARFLGRYADAASGTAVEVVIDRGYLALRDAAGAHYHLWKVPGREQWRVRANLALAITFQERDGHVVSFTQRSAGSPDLVLLREEPR